MCSRRLFVFLTATMMLVFLAPPRAEAEIGINLWAYTDTAQSTPRFDCEADGLHPFPYEKSGIGSTGTMGKDSCSLSGQVVPPIVNRDFHLQSIGSSGEQQENVLYKINTVTGGIAGNSLLEQRAIFFTYNSGDYVMSYGVSHAAPPVTDQAYVYVGQANSAWMHDLLQGSYAAVKFKDLVLPGAHDAGMYMMNVEDLTAAVKQMCGENAALQKICGAASEVGEQLIANLALTQKDNTTDQLRFGIRFFDFRPAYASDGVAYHVHGFVPGVGFTKFLDEIDTFLKKETKEVVVIQITASGIDRKQFKPLTQKQVKKALANAISASVGFDLTTDISSYGDRSLADVVASGKRVLVIFGKTNVNDSYQDEKGYTTYLTDTKGVIGALDAALERCSSSEYQYNVFQFQDTGSAALGNYVPQIVAHLSSWANDLVLSGTGSILQATKPIFDHDTYTWLIDEDTRDGIEKCPQPVFLINDFVDAAMVSHAIAMTQYRYDHRSH